MHHTIQFKNDDTLFTCKFYKEGTVSKDSLQVLKSAITVWVNGSDVLKKKIREEHGAVLTIEELAEYQSSDMFNAYNVVDFSIDCMPIEDQPFSSYMPLYRLPTYDAVKDDGTGRVVIRSRGEDGRAIKRIIIVDNHLLPANQLADKIVSLLNSNP